MYNYIQSQLVRIDAKVTLGPGKHPAQGMDGRDNSVSETALMNKNISYMKIQAPHWIHGDASRN